MMIHKECSQLRKNIHELLVEPQSAPFWLKEWWKSHRKTCIGCRNFFASTQKYHNFSRKILLYLSLDDELFAIMKNGSVDRNRKPLSRWLFAAAASILAIAISGIWVDWPEKKQKQIAILPPNPSYQKTVQRYYGKTGEASSEHIQKKWQFLKQQILQCLHAEKKQNQTKPKATAALIDNDSQQGECAASSKIQSWINEISSHIEKIDQEFAALEKLTSSYQDSSRMPLLKKQLWATLANGDSHQKIMTLQEHGYPVEEIKVLFVKPIDDIAGNEELEREATDFFRVASPHMFNIWSHRSAFMESVSKCKANDFRGKKKLLDFIEDIENSVPF